MNEPREGWTLRKLYQALRKMVVNPAFLKYLQNHSGLELRNAKKTYRYGSFDVVEMENGDTYWIKFSIRKQAANDDPQSKRDPEIQP